MPLTRYISDIAALISLIPAAWLGMKYPGGRICRASRENKKAGALRRLFSVFEFLAAISSPAGPP
jgi:hypothetical protein